MDMCFKKIDHESRLRPMLINLITETPPDYWMPYYNFSALLVPSSITNEDPFLKKLSEKREFQAGLLKVPANTCYNWHVDTDRNSALNMLVYDDGQSKCLFSPEGMKIVLPTVELRYSPNHFYAFNTKIMHIVLNFTTPRYLFSLEFMGKDYGLTYEQLLEDIKELGYGS